MLPLLRRAHGCDATSWIPKGVTYVVVVPWENGVDCVPVRFSRSVRRVEHGMRGMYSAALRPRSDRVGGTPALDAASRLRASPVREIVQSVRWRGMHTTLSTVHHRAIGKFRLTLEVTNCTPGTILMRTEWAPESGLASRRGVLRPEDPIAVPPWDLHNYLLFVTRAAELSPHGTTRVSRAEKLPHGRRVTVSGERLSACRACADAALFPCTTGD